MLITNYNYIMHPFFCYNMYIKTMFSTFISHIWVYILERNNKQCVNIGYAWSSFSVHMTYLLFAGMNNENRQNHIS